MRGEGVGYGEKVTLETAVAAIITGIAERSHVSKGMKGMNRG